MSRACAVVITATLPRVALRARRLPRTRYWRIQAHAPFAVTRRPSPGRAESQWTTYPPVGGVTDATKRWVRFGIGTPRSARRRGATAAHGSRHGSHNP